MRYGLILRVLGRLLLVYSISMFPSIIIAWHNSEEPQLFAFSYTLAVILGCGLALSFLFRKYTKELQSQDGFLLVVFFWIGLSLVSALPFYFNSDMSLMKALFEAVSGFTTTGATVMTGLDDAPVSLLYYRQQLQLLGGLGVVVLAIAVLPMLGVGGLQLFRAEAPGPMHEDKLTPRLLGTIRALLGIYLFLLLSCVASYMWAGMTFYEALMHSYTTVSTSGFSIYDSSFGYFSDQPFGWKVELVAIIFMLLGSLNFTVHYVALTRFNLPHYLRDVQVRVFLGIVLVVTFICMLTLTLSSEFTGSSLDAVRQSAFHVVSIITTTGYTTADGFANMPLYVPTLIFSCGFIGGCVGSTAGGFRVMRIIVLSVQGLREIKRLIHPNAVIPLRVGGHRVSERVVEAVAGFAFLYITTFVLISLAMMGTGLHAYDAFSATAATLNMVGPGLGTVAENFASMNNGTLGLGILAMLLGRLEIFTLLVLLMPEFWRQ